MFHFQILVFAIILSLKVLFCRSAETSCEQSEKLFADLCFTPTPSEDFDTGKYKALQPADGWHVEIGNDISRLHVAEVLKGKLLKQEEITDDFCPKIKIEHGDNAHHADGEYFGFGDLYTNFTCEGSKDFPGVLKCKFENSRGEGYTERVNTYISLVDNKEGFFVLIGCFETGEVGWYTGSVINKLTDQNKKTVEDHVTLLGFPPGTTLNMFKDSCK